ncbi:hypothetical protein BDW59DRAFT_152301 [Aspergillus cavernicola]|uniref:Uncharacterized protein n=1 Tax=Aspergillus cavernicola TaxID=176166 RepID=A0ABR4HTB1_9EURO
MPSLPNLQHVFTLHVDLAPALDPGTTFSGDRRFIPITGGHVAGPKLNGKIISNSSGNWNAVRLDGVVHLYAQYTIQADDGTLIGIINEGYGRASQETMKAGLRIRIGWLRRWRATVAVREGGIQGQVRSLKLRGIGQRISGFLGLYSWGI